MSRAAGCAPTAPSTKVTKPRFNTSSERVNASCAGEGVGAAWATSAPTEVAAPPWLREVAVDERAGAGVAPYPLTWLLPVVWLLPLLMALLPKPA